MRGASTRDASYLRHQAEATTTPEIRAAPLTLLEGITQSHEPVTNFQKPVPSLPCRLELVFPLVAQGSRSVTDQALIQLCALPVTLLLAALGGCLTGEFCLQCNGMEGVRGRGIDGFWGKKGQEQPQSKASPSGKPGRAQWCSEPCKSSGGREYHLGPGFSLGWGSPRALGSPRVPAPRLPPSAAARCQGKPGQRPPRSQTPSPGFRHPQVPF